MKSMSRIFKTRMGVALKTVSAILLMLFSYNALIAQETSYEYKAVILYDSMFRLHSNSIILSNVKSAGWNSVFLYVKTIPKDSTNSLYNLGLKVEAGSNPLSYQEKVVNFLDSAANSGIKVFALNFELYRSDSTISEKAYSRLMRKAKNLAYYQKHVRNDSLHANYYNKKAHFHGIVTNMEPWILECWNYRYSESQQQWVDSASMCYASTRDTNNKTVGDYIVLIDSLYKCLDTNGFFNPVVSSLADTAQQGLDELYMGTVHWNWHYFANAWETGDTTYKYNFRNGDFRNFVGETSSTHLFDILLPETYCPKSGNTCLSRDCIDTSLVILCDRPGEYINYEKNGSCYEWFDKHYFDGSQLDPAMDTLPIQVAPMLLGHSAYLFSTKGECKSEIKLTAESAKRCFGHSNYRGYFLYQYKKYMSLSAGLEYSVKLCPDQSAPPDSFGCDTTENSREIVVYPMPSSSYLYLKGLLPGDEVMIFNFNRDLLISSEDDTIDVSMLDEGHYVLLVRDLNSVFVYRQIIQISKI